MIIKLRKISYLLTCLSVFLVIITGCNEDEFSKKERTENLLGEKIENSLGIMFNHGASSYGFHIINQEEIKELEELFIGAEFYEFEKPQFKGDIQICFYGKNGKTQIYINHDNYITINDNTYVKAKEITYAYLRSLYDEQFVNLSDDIEPNIVEDIKGNPLKIEIKNTSEMLLGRDFNLNMYVVTDHEFIKELEDLFNEAEFINSDKPINNPMLHITFYGENSMDRFLIDSTDVIRLQDGKHVKAKGISYNKLYSLLIKRKWLE